MEAVKRGLKRGLNQRVRTVLLMLDETIITETPPLYSAYGRIGMQIKVPISGNRSKRIVHGVINIKNGEIDLLISRELNSQSHMHFLEQIRSKWRGWNIVLFEDRGTFHTSDDTTELLEKLKIETRLLPKATSELNAMDQLWRRTKGETLGSRATLHIDQSALLFCKFIISLSPQERLRKAGVFSDHFWLSKRGHL